MNRREDFGSWKDEYDEGWNACFNGADENDNPYTPSGHERETTWIDECHFAWYCGWGDAWSEINES